ncbi:MAG: hypothetical protein ABR616_05930 [Dermatophilaceae bacterium]|nr:hypothetical protein [Intrasporangiaceae bacterium]
MSDYAYVVDGSIVRVGRLPRNGTLSDGRPVSGFDKLPAAMLAAEGWVEVVEPERPAHDPASEFLTSAVELIGGTPTRVYTVETIPPQPGPADGHIEHLALLGPHDDPALRAWLQSQVEQLIADEQDPVEKARLQARYVEEVPA